MKEIKGLVKAIKVQDYQNRIVVEYEVDGKKYTINEQLIMKPKEKIKLGFLPIGYKSVSLIEKNTGIRVKVGSKVNVMYDENCPEKAYLKENKGRVSWD